MIDKNSPTWRHVQRFIEQESDQAIAYLISDMDSEKQRGALAVLKKLTAEADPDQPEVIVSDSY